jgi:hypothetical protein
MTTDEIVNTNAKAYGSAAFAAEFIWSHFMIKFAFLLLSSVILMAQNIPPRPPDPLERPAAPATTQAPDGVRNGTTKGERDQHSEAGVPGPFVPPPLPTPSIPK